ncbi:NUDIX domain-containing protein [Stappia sp.]|uniref:NUDIX domain-containing protein n=1 Tax=Stappia sp. TaxID=1870903 RepID=UPI0032D8BCA5
MTDTEGRRDGVRILARRTLYEGFSRYCEMDVEERSADGATHVLSREFQTRADVIAVLPYDPHRAIALLARQLRVPLLARGDHDGYLAEAPAGYIDAGEDAGTAARREAAEEVGVALAHLEPAGTVFSSPGAMTERISLFLAPFSAADRRHDGGGLAHEGERIEVLEVPLADLAAEADAGRLADAKTLILVQALRLRRPGLFA